MGYVRWPTADWSGWPPSPGRTPALVVACGFAGKKTKMDFGLNGLRDTQARFALHKARNL